MHKIVIAGNLDKKDVVLEIGPGTGLLTEVLLANAGRVVAVEKDRELIGKLQEKFVKEIKAKKFLLIEADILDFDPKKYELKNYKLIANIPYYITGAIIRKFLEEENQPSQIVLLVQKEVAERIAREKKESLLSISVKAYGTPKYIATVPRGAFAPSPNVDSAILSIADISKNNFAGISEKHFFKVLHAGFAHKRKQLMGNLSGIYGKEKAFAALSSSNIAPVGRAEDLPVEKWFVLAGNL